MYKYDCMCVSMYGYVCLQHAGIPSSPSQNGRGRSTSSKQVPSSPSSRMPRHSHTQTQAQALGLGLGLRMGPQQDVMYVPMNEYVCMYPGRQV